MLRVPKTVDCIQNILTVIPLQLLSYHVAELKGLNVSCKDCVISSVLQAFIPCRLHFKAVVADVKWKCFHLVEIRFRLIVHAT